MMNRTPGTVPVPTKGRTFVRVDSAMLERYGSNVAVFFAKISNLMNMCASTSVYFSNKKMEKETGMKIKPQRRARTVLRDERLLKEKRMGKGAMIHYIFDEECKERYNALFFNGTSKQAKTVQKGTSKQAKTVQKGTSKQTKTVQKDTSKQTKTVQKDTSHIRENILKRENILNKGDFEKSKSRASLFSEKSQEDFSPSGGEPRKEPALEGKNKTAGDSFSSSKGDSQGEKSQGKNLSKEKKKTPAETRFNTFWDLYGKKKHKDDARRLFFKLSAKDQQLAIDRTHLYNMVLKAKEEKMNFAQGKKYPDRYLRGKYFREDFESELLELGVKIPNKGNAGEVSPSALTCVEAFHKKYKETHWTKVYTSYYKIGKVGELWEKLQEDYPEEAKQVYCIIAFGKKYKADWTEKKDLYNPIYKRGELDKLWKMIQKDYPKKAKAIFLQLSNKRAS